LLHVNHADEKQENNSNQHTCAGKQAFPQPGMQKFVNERFVQYLCICQQYLQASKERRKERKKEKSTHLARDLFCQGQ
jgi:hypothetical protein